MILEDETFEAFGYEVWELKPHSDKRILAACDECGKVRETSKNGYHSLCRSCTMTGRTRKPFTEEHKAKIGVASKGRHPTEETRAIMSAYAKGKTGDKNPNWQGGISFEPYCVKFNNAFKEYIRAKFEYKCFLCPTTQAENGKKLSVHHVNYNKDCGCDGDKTCNFVPLCHSCHAKTNGNRDYWEKLITNKLHCLIIGWNV